VSSRRSAVGVLALGALLAAACDRAEPPPTSPEPAAGTVPATASGTAPRDGAAAVTPPSRPPPAAAGFDVGEIKSAAEYSRDPEFAEADVKRGELLSLACAACHTFGAGQPKLIGPNLHGVFGRRAAALPDFEYSSALRASNLVWTPRALEAWLADPTTFVAGTTMTFSGYRTVADRRNLIAYLLHATQ
jgi:cytochrome c